MDLNVAAANGLVKPVVIDQRLICVPILPPYLDAEGVIVRVEVLGPDHKLVHLAIGRQYFYLYCERP